MMPRRVSNCSYQFLLFATRADYEPIIRYCEEKASLKYARFGDWETEIPEIFFSALDLPAFGVATHAKSLLEPSYLVTYHDMEMSTRKVEMSKGGVRYIATQWENPISVVFQPGGVFEDHAIIQGELSTLAEERGAVDLFRLFTKGFRKFFITVSDFYWLGPEAVQLLKAGYRLTADIGLPPKNDFKVEWLNCSVG